MENLRFSLIVSEVEGKRLLRFFCREGEQEVLRDFYSLTSFLMENHAWRAIVK
jgi:hypothetical protein